MKQDYFLIHKKILPSYYEKVLLIKETINKGVNVSLACKKHDLSRSTYYKYKDYVHRPSIRGGRHLILTMKLVDEPGALSHILNVIASQNANISAINQEMPIHNIAFITLTIAITDQDFSIQKFINSLKKLEHVVDVTLIAVE